MYPNRHPGPPPAAGQPFKFTVAETCDRIKEEFSYLQAQYHRDTVSLKLECEKLASEKTEMQRHYVMYYEMSYGLNVEMHKQVLCALSFYAFGCYQRKIGNDVHIIVSQSSASNCIKEVSEAMSKNLLKKYVKFPNDENLQKSLKEEFFEYCGLGGVLGAIDCTHVSIIAPPDDGFHHEKNYINRKGWHSINVQLVCNMDMQIMNVCARFPGCTHDAYIWLSSNLKKAFDTGRKVHGDGWLLGDSGYHQEEHLHVPYATASPGSEAEMYNRAHSRGRCVIERCNGVLKNRFRCLMKHRTLHYRPEAACKIINACIILHNMCINENLCWEDVDLPSEDQLFDTVSE